MTEMGIAEFTKIKNRVLELVRKDDKYTLWWPSRKFRGFLYFMAENLVQLTPERATMLFKAVYPDEPSGCDAEVAMREMFARDVEGNLWFPSIDTGDVDEAVQGFFALLGAEDKTLLLTLHFVYGLVDYLLRTYQESFSLPGSWGENVYIPRELYLGLLAGLDPAQSSSENWDRLEGIYARTSGYTFTIEPWME